MLAENVKDETEANRVFNDLSLRVMSVNQCTVTAAKIRAKELIQSHLVNQPGTLVLFSGWGVPEAPKKAPMTVQFLKSRTNISDQFVFPTPPNGDTSPEAMMEYLIRLNREAHEEVENEKVADALARSLE